jgi:hypothetical protein
VSLEVDCHCDVVGGTGGQHLAPEEQLVSVGQLGQSDQGQFQFEAGWGQGYRSEVSRQSPISSSAWLSSLMA